MGRKKRRGSLLSGVSPMTVASGVTSSGAAAGGSVQGPLWSLYNLQESSGTRVDQMGNNDMDVLVNNPGRATGISDDGYALNLDGTQYVKSTNDIILLLLDVDNNQSIPYDNTLPFTTNIGIPMAGMSK